MRKYFTVLMVVVTVFTLQSCVKEVDVFIPDPGQIMGPDSTWYSKPSSLMPVGVLKTNLMIHPDVDSIDNSGISANFISVSGLECNFAPASFVDSLGNPVPGKIAVESNLLLHKGDLLLMAKPTSSGDTVLVSGGAFFVQATKNGKELKLAPDKKIYVRYASNNTFPVLSLYNGDNSDFEKFNWIRNVDTMNGNNAIKIGSSFCEVTTNRQGWVNSNYKLETAGTQLTSLAAVLPSTYTNANTMAFLVFNDLNAVIGMYGDKTTKNFTSIKVPVGRSVTVVTITKEGNFYFLGHNSLVTSVPASNTTIQKVNINPVKSTLDNIKSYLRTL